MMFSPVSITRMQVSRKDESDGTKKVEISGSNAAVDDACSHLLSVCNSQNTKPPPNKANPVDFGSLPGELR